MNEQKRLDLNELASDEARLAEVTAGLEGKPVDESNPLWVESFTASGSKGTQAPSPTYEKTLSVTLES